ncbi:MAG: trypsin-like serine protease [Deltaproteobacteria bacterium]|nr:trypsin-like serine protease [Deltaproteobacteria bacterium]
MVVSGTEINEFNRILLGCGFDGVVRVSMGGYYGTGSLLYDGRAVLTVAHLVSGEDVLTGKVMFETIEGVFSSDVSKVLVHPDYDDVNSNADIALLWLDEPAPVSADRYSLFYPDVEIGQLFTMVGYGQQGIGLDGVNDDVDVLDRLKTQNTVDGDAGDLKLYLGAQMSWYPLADTVWVSDFDSGFSGEDALSEWLNYTHLGVGDNEGITAGGDSGGPAFINGQIAGIASYGAHFETLGFSPDIDDIVNSSFGELAFWQKISAYEEWIDQSIRSTYEDSPTSKDEVVMSIVEGDSDTQLIYFLVEFNGIRGANDVVSVDYRTVDGTAVAGEDFLAVQGTLQLYESEGYAVIPVEVIGDELIESDEVFYLEVSNPVGGTFTDDVQLLTAQRTIFNDDYIGA